MNTELLEALNLLEKEKNISKTVLLEAIQQSLLRHIRTSMTRSTM